MIYFSDAELDAYLLEDIYRGDLTTRAMGIGKVSGKMVFKRKNAGRVAGVTVGAALLTKLGLSPVCFAADGDDVEAGTVLIEVKGDGELLQQGWKVVQLVLEWSCGVAQYMADMVANAREVNPNTIVACTRKTIPGTRKLATDAVIAGGGHIHRAGVSETVLVFTNHRRLFEQPDDWKQQVERIRREAPENKITVEADNIDEVRGLIDAEPDIIQLDKFSVQDVIRARELVEASGKPIMLSSTGGMRRENAAEYAATGVNLFVTSAPYYAQPDDIKVIITKE